MFLLRGALLVVSRRAESNNGSFCQKAFSLEGAGGGLGGAGRQGKGHRLPYKFNSEGENGPGLVWSWFDGQSVSNEGIMCYWANAARNKDTLTWESISYRLVSGYWDKKQCFRESLRLSVVVAGLRQGADMIQAVERSVYVQINKPVWRTKKKKEVISSVRGMCRAWVYVWGISQRGEAER